MAVAYERLYDASDSTTINAGSPTDGDPVDTWADIGSGAAWTVTQATATARAIWRDNFQNGLAVVEFDGTDDRLAKAGIGVADNKPQPFFVALVCKFTGNTASSTRYVLSAGTDTTHRTVLWVENGQWEIFAGGQRVSGSAVTNDVVIVTAVFDGANSLIRVNGVEATGSVDTRAHQGQVLGALDNNGTSPFPGWIGEFGMLYSRPTAQEILDEESRLESKWVGAPANTLQPTDASTSFVAETPSLVPSAQAISPVDPAFSFSAEVPTVQAESMTLAPSDPAFTTTAETPTILPDGTIISPTDAAWVFAAEAPTLTTFVPEQQDITLSVVSPSLRDMATVRSPGANYTVAEPEARSLATVAASVLREAATVGEPDELWDVIESDVLWSISEPVLNR